MSIILSNHMRICQYRHILMPVLCLFCLTSCNDDTDIVCDYPQEQLLTAKTADTPSELYKAYAISVFNGKYVFSKKGDYFLTIIDSTFIGHYELLRKGHGENEWMAPMLTGQHVTIDGKELVCILERSNGVLYASDVEDSIAHKRILLADLNKKGIPDARNAFIIHNGKIVGQRDSKNCEWFICNDTEAKASFINSGIDDKLFQYNPQILSQGLIAYHEASKTFIQTFFAYPLLCFLDEDCNIKKKIQLCNRMPAYNEKTAVEPFNYIVDIFPSDKYIYVLFDSHERETKNKMHILVFDWDANPVAKLQIDRSQAFAVDEKKSIILSINEDDEKGCCSIYYYNSTFGSK